jgi:hypothetical protein
MARTSSEQWAKHVERWRDSGLSAKEFAVETGLKASTLSYWRWKLSAAARASADGEAEVAQTAGKAELKRRVERRRRTARVLPSCVELPVATVATAPAMLELLLGDVRVRVPSDFDEAALTRVVRALGAAR